MFELPLLEHGWSPITKHDEPLYASYFAQSDEPYSYEQNWAFITQETRLGGMKYEDNGMLLTAVTKANDSPFIFILPPYGNTHHFSARIEGRLTELSKASAKRLVLRKLSKELCERVLLTKKFTVLPASEFTHPRDVPEDKFPQIVLDVSGTLAMQGSKYRRLRNDLKYFARQCKPEVLDLNPSNCKDVMHLIRDWCQNYNHKNESGLSLSEPPIVDLTAYTILADEFASVIDNSEYFAKLVYVGGRLAAFTLAGRSGPYCAAQYVNLSLLRVRGCSEFMLFALLHELSHADVSYLNLGGAETEGQFLYKSKFDVRLVKQSFEVEYIPTHQR